MIIITEDYHPSEIKKRAQPVKIGQVMLFFQLMVMNYPCLVISILKSHTRKERHVMKKLLNVFVSIVFAATTIFITNTSPVINITRSENETISYDYMGDDDSPNNPVRPIYNDR